MKKPVQSQEEIDEMRRRLYDRGAGIKKTERHGLTDVKIDVSKNWGPSVSKVRPSRQPKPIQTAPTTDLREGMTSGQTQSNNPGPDVVVEQPTTQIKSRPYRMFILLGSLAIFIFVAVVSSLYLYFGGNQISSDNIQIAVQGPNHIGGGETMSFQVAVSNHNSVTIDSATLIVKYPPGTRSTDENSRNLYEERIPVTDIAMGEVRNIPISVVVYGEENVPKQIEATIEYRVNGSNGMFYKDADPLTFSITSSPLVLRIENIEKVASGQLVDIKMTAVSNASAPLRDLVITASYPNGFRFEQSDPEPVFGDNVWRIDELLPEEEIAINVQGIVTGLTEETFRINFAAGPSDPSNQFLVGANLAEGKADFEIERPFIDVSIAINGDTGRSIIIDEAEDSNVEVNITNTLDETVYDMVVEVVPGGNALTPSSIISNQGFYDSNRGAVVWEVSNNKSFDKILPGDYRELSFLVKPDTPKSTASYELVVNVYARRVAETSAQETLIGTIRAEAKFSSQISVGAQASRSSSNFSDTGPIPPKVGETTTYTISVVAQAGVNDITGAIVETSLPVYVDWLDTYSGEGNVSYNSVSKQITWDVGDMSSGRSKQLDIQVSIKPSISQLKTLPVLLNKQIMRANDRYTGALLQETSPAVTTELSTEMGFEADNGRVTQ